MPPSFAILTVATLTYLVATVATRPHRGSPAHARAAANLDEEAGAGGDALSDRPAR
jgi:hypothetical protein